MSNVLKTGFLLGLGAAVSSKEKVDKYVDELLVKGKVTPKEADELYHSLLQKGEETEEEWHRRTKERMQETMEELNLFTREEYNELKGRIDDLEKRLAKFENQDSE
ncbi:phasin family protein [Salisediminibacterium halotolerans]|uniref:Polyhydroxyalkanoate synthesis regulator phasin n=1 Tax=Salisediminibacterium halotolerans TaxID=517425 RepID=A0A1H9TIF0_9BACI|nr:MULTISPECIES: hypothetical protein [Salisediminibacterium]RLJ72367.1 polyhydroxyalkanoate synthesis regulator phasin [Actinophytocola xinjiangensis]RPE85582.1 polyhydroxyalkanoate synthesis regulator phasin [Salisediminibacterium halotolerans]TWG33536.1 polyhydroxyalkanoate synthesis regulator phasin [Salisediminibacterium halotolerans]SER97120.1 Polyhydroxyalkanoate synthesis regulator phasin [Salisediminibacterium haloalkalitolerans]GEL08735.1 hypothetical protein SHA02_21510 [Salisedimin